MKEGGVITNATNWRSHANQGRCVFNGLPITIENERGSYRQGIDNHGKPWRTFMHIAYGYIHRTMGVDGDHVDAYLGPNKYSRNVFIVHQVDPVTGKYDEDKVMLGFNTASEAKANYVRQYDSAKYFGTMDKYNIDTFKRMLVSKEGVKLKKSLEKALVPVMRQVTRKGKTFQMRFWVSPTQAKQESRPRVEEAPPSKPLRATPTVSLMTMDRMMDYAPDSKIVVDKVMGMQAAMYGGHKPTIQEVYHTAADELEFAITETMGESGEGWYSEKIRETRSILTKVFPQMADDQEWKFFAAILALTSPRQPVSMNMNSAVKIYTLYKETGRLPVKQPSGKNWPGPMAEKVLTDVQGRIDELGMDGFVRWMEMGSTGAELKKLNPSFRGKKSEFYPNAMRYGPKVGAFYNNLIGEFSLSTIDTWATRSWRRWTNNVERVRNSQGRWSINEKVENTAEQKNIDALFQTLAQEFDMEVADVQAVLWYYEKRLYTQIGAGSSASEDISFEEAAQRVYDSFTGNP